MSGEIKEGVAPNRLSASNEGVYLNLPTLELESATTVNFVMSCLFIAPRSVQS